MAVGMALRASHQPAVRTAVAGLQAEAGGKKWNGRPGLLTGIIPARPGDRLASTPGRKAKSQTGAESRPASVFTQLSRMLDVRGEAWPDLSVRNRSC